MLSDNYHIVDKGYNSFPTKIPGTAYHKALLVRNVLSTIHPYMSVVAA
jgi:(+)-abscisic acid 8'-hydroxylase